MSNPLGGTYFILCKYNGMQSYADLLVAVRTIEYICGSPIKTAAASLRRNAPFHGDPERRARFQDSLDEIGQYINYIQFLKESGHQRGYSLPDDRLSAHAG